MGYADSTRVKREEDTFSVEEMNAGQVTSQISKQSGLLEDLDTAVDGLFNRLSDITREREVKEDDLATPRETLVPTASCIENNNDRIISSISRLQRLTGFIEL